MVGVGLQQQGLRVVAGHLLAQRLVGVVQQPRLATVLNQRAQLLTLIKTQGFALVAMLRRDQVIVAVVPITTDGLTRVCLDIQQAVLTVVYQLLAALVIELTAIQVVIE
ncbi:hypothetical protein D3C86_1499840 [compost metagenome]